MKKLLMLLGAAMLVIIAVTADASGAGGCKICMFNTSDGQIRATCGSTSAGSKACIPSGSNCMQSVDCCGCGQGPKPSGAGGTCLSRERIPECDLNPADHDFPEFGIVIWQPAGARRGQ
ncbi:MAG: hypothetical protein ACREAA_18825 [Candidatus Polarisedimenticolia bacterium]